MKKESALGYFEEDNLGQSDVVHPEGKLSQGLTWKRRSVMPSPVAITLLTGTSGTALILSQGRVSKEWRLTISLSCGKN